MTTVLMTKEVETVHSRFTEDDLFSLDDVPSKPSSNVSLFSDYGFSDDCLSDYAFSGHERGSFKDLESMYVEKEDDNLKSEKQKKQPSGSLEALLSPTARKKTQKLKPRYRSSNLDALLSPTLSGKKKTAKRSSKLEALLSPTQKKTAKGYSKAETKKSSDSSDQVDKKVTTKRVSAPATCDGSRNEPDDTWLEIDEDEYETDTSDEFEYETDTDDEYETDTDDELFDGPTSSATAVSKTERALSMERSSMKRSLSKKRDTLSPSNRRKGRKEEVLVAQSPRSPRHQSLSKQRMTDALSLSNHSKGKTEEPRKARKGSKRQSFLEGSASNLDDTPKRSSSLRNMSIARRSSSAPKRKRKSFDRSNHSTSGDDAMSQPSAPVVRLREKDSLDTSTRSDGGSAVTRRRSRQSTTPRRSLSHGTRRKQKDSGDSSVASESRRRSSSKPKPSDPQLDSGLLSPGSTKLRRKIKRASSTYDEVIQPESIRRTISGSVQARRGSSSNKKTIKTRDASPSSSKSMSKSTFRSTSLRAKGEEMAAVSRELTNLSLSTSDHGGPSKRSSKAGKTSTVRKIRRYSTAI